MSRTGDAARVARSKSGRTEVWLAASSSLLYPDGRFDAALAVHVLYFWPDAETIAQLPASVYALRSVEETEGLLAQAGFVATRSTTHSIGRSQLVCTEAGSPAPE